MLQSAILTLNMSGRQEQDSFDALVSAANAAGDDAANATEAAQRAVEYAQRQTEAADALALMKQLGVLALDDAELQVKLRDPGSTESQSFQMLVTWVLQAAELHRAGDEHEVSTLGSGRATSDIVTASAHSEQAPKADAYVIQLADGRSVTIGEEDSTLADDMYFILSAYLGADVPLTSSDLVKMGFHVNDEIAPYARQRLLKIARERLNVVFQAACGEDAFISTYVQGGRGVRFVLNERLRAATIERAAASAAEPGENSKKK